MSNDRRKTFSDVTLAQFECMQINGGKFSPPAIYSPSEGPKGFVSITTLVGNADLTFDYDQGAKTLTYVIVKESPFLPAVKIWIGFQEALNSCKNVKK